MGHSGSTGESSDPDQPGVEIRKNSWVTGTNPKVNSLYQRLLAVHPQIKGHAVALSQGGATVDDLVRQAADAVTEQPPSPVVVIQIMDNDIICPASKQDLTQFQDTFQTALRTLDEGLPTSRLFVVSQFGSPASNVAASTPAQRRKYGSTGPCAYLDLKGHPVPTKIKRLDDTIHGYEARLAAGCAKFARCVYDDGAFGNVVDRPQYIAIDGAHFSVAGHAKAAAVAWGAMRRGGLVPARR